MEEWKKTFTKRMFAWHENMPGGFEDSSLIQSQNQIEKKEKCMWWGRIGQKKEFPV